LLNYRTWYILPIQFSTLGKVNTVNLEKEEGGQRITDYDILQLCKNAKSDITQYIVIGEIISGVRFIVTQKEYPYLNLVIEPTENTPYDWVLTVVTVMNNQNFVTGSKQLQIFV